LSAGIGYQALTLFAEDNFPVLALDAVTFSCRTMLFTQFLFWSLGFKHGLSEVT